VSGVPVAQELVRLVDLPKCEGLRDPSYNRTRGSIAGENPMDLFWNARSMMRRFVYRFLSIVGIVLGFAQYSHAASVTYTFESPLFTLGQTTAINVIPNIGDPGFQATFLPGISIGNGAPYPPFTGQALFAGVALNLIFNTPVTHMSLGFALPVPRHGAFLTIVTPTDSVDVNPTFGNGLVQGGNVDFTPTSPFTTVTLYGFRAAFEADPGSPSEFGIDNLTLTTADEPSSLSLLAFVLPALVICVHVRMRTAIRPAA